MSIGQLFFGFSGRINRAKFWAATVTFVVVIVLFTVVSVVAIIDGGDYGRIAYGIPFNPGVGGVAIVLALLVLVMFVSQLAVAVKRLHDRDKSGWWALPMVVLPAVLGWIISPPWQEVSATSPSAGAALAGLIQLAFGIWWLVELGCLRGTQGPNRFGPDPIPTYSGRGALAEPPYPDQPAR